MRHGRWIAAVTGLVAVAALAAPAAAGVKSAASNQAIFRAGVVSAADTPPGWTSRKQTDSGVGQFKSLPDCKQIVAVVGKARKSPRMLSPEFSDPNAPTSTTVADVVFALKSAKAAQQTLAAYQARSALPCFQELFKKALGNVPAQVTVTPISDLQGVGDANAGFEATIAATGSGQSLKLVGEFIAVRVGRAYVAFNFLNSNERLPQGPAIVNGIVNRLRAVTG
jgi:hypothetical protein